ncbi:MAG: CheR family methyltransferase [Minicystis sp.]
MSRLTAAQIDTIRRLVADHAGLDIPDERVGELVEIVGRPRGEGGFAGYVARLAAHADGGRELSRIAVALAVHETYFFRDRAQLDVLVERVIPGRARAQGRGRIRVLSAGASTGAEAYSIAILLRERRPDLAAAVDISGIDLAPAAIEAARRGRYPLWTLRDTAKEIVARYFRPRGELQEIRDDLRAAVSFEVKNLLGPASSFWAPGSFDAILCRNVIMYLARAPAQAAVTRLEQALAPGGYLFLGHAETLRHFQTKLDPVREGDAFCYVKPGATRPESAEPVAPAVAAPRVDAPRPIAPRFGLRHAARATPAAREATPVERARSDPEALIRRAIALVERGDLGRAEEACAEAQAADDLDPIPHYLKALCRERAGDAAGAARHAVAASYLDPTFAMPCLHLARLARRAGDLRAAQRELSRARLLLAREDDERLDLLGGGLDRRALLRLCDAELRSVEAAR